LCLVKVDFPLLEKLKITAAAATSVARLAS
jgi:hypothetical protein